MLTQRKDSQILLDACCIINLAASGYFLDIIDSFPNQFLVAKYVFENEILSILDQFSEESIITRIEKRDFLACTRIVDIQTNEEAEVLIDYVNRPNLDSGEAYSAAIAVSRKYILATDDKAAIKLAIQEGRPEIISTLKIIHYWSESKLINFKTVSLALSNIQTFGKYRPGRNHEYYSWWRNHCKTE